MSSESKCPNCGEESIYRARDVSASGRTWPFATPMTLLPKLGHLLTPPTFTVLVCADCGLTRLFADTEARSNLATSNRWTKVPS